MAVEKMPFEPGMIYSTYELAQMWSERSGGLLSTAEVLDIWERAPDYAPGGPRFSLPSSSAGAILAAGGLEPPEEDENMSRERFADLLFWPCLAGVVGFVAVGNWAFYADDGISGVIKLLVGCAELSLGSILLAAAVDPK